MGRKGQSLVEFILILPIFLMVLFSLIDFGIIFYEKSHLENVSSEIIEAISKTRDINTLRNNYKDISISIKDDNNYKEIIITKNIDTITPGLNLVLGDPYQIKVSRYIYD